MASPDIAPLLESAPGARLAQAEYQRDFGARLWLAKKKKWKLERLQNYAETGFASWEAFVAGDWRAALELIEQERAGFRAFYRRFAEHGGGFRRLRIVEEPVAPYVQWEFHVLLARADCGELCRVLHADRITALEANHQLADLVSLCGQTLYRTLYTDTGTQRARSAAQTREPSAATKNSPGSYPSQGKISARTSTER